MGPNGIIMLDVFVLLIALGALAIAAWVVVSSHKMVKPIADFWHSVGVLNENIENRVQRRVAVVNQNLGGQGPLDRSHVSQAPRKPLAEAPDPAARMTGVIDELAEITREARRTRNEALDFEVRDNMRQNLDGVEQ